MKYSVYLGSCEQHKYTFDAVNLKELRQKITNTWSMLYTGQWIKRKYSKGLPKNHVRYFVWVNEKCMGYPGYIKIKKPVLIIWD